MMCFCNLNIGLILLYGIMELYGVYGVNNLNNTCRAIQSGLNFVTEPEFLEYLTHVDVIILLI